MTPEVPNPRVGWDPLPPEHLPRPTYFPVGLAIGTTLLFWGLITSWMVLVAGLVFFCTALAGWVSEIRHERKEH